MDLRDPNESVGLLFVLALLWVIAIRAVVRRSRDEIPSGRMESLLEDAEHWSPVGRTLGCAAVGALALFTLYVAIRAIASLLVE